MTATEEINPSQEIELPEKTDGNTFVHALSSRSFLKILIMKEGMTALIVCGAVVIMGILLGVLVNLNILLGALMFVFLIVPGILMFLYFNHSLKPWTALNTSPHLLTLREKDVELLLTGSGRSINLPYEDFGDYYLYGKAVVLNSAKKQKGWLWLPLEAFDDEADMNNFLKLLKQK